MGLPFLHRICYSVPQALYKFSIRILPNVFLCFFCSFKLVVVPKTWNHQRTTMFLGVKIDKLDDSLGRILSLLLTQACRWEVLRRRAVATWVVYPYLTKLAHDLPVIILWNDDLIQIHVFRPKYEQEIVTWVNSFLILINCIIQKGFKFKMRTEGYLR